MDKKKVCADRFVGYKFVGRVPLENAILGEINNLLNQGREEKLTVIC